MRDLPARRPWLVLALAGLLTWGAVVSATTLEAEVDFLDTVPQHEGLDAYRALLAELDGVRFSAIYMARDPAAPYGSLRSEEGFDALVREQANLTRFLAASFPDGTFSHTLSAHEAMRQGNYMLAKIATAGNAPPEAYDMPGDAVTYEAVRRQVLADGSLDDVLARDGSSALVLAFFSTRDASEARALAGEVDEAVRTWAAREPEHPATAEHATSGLLQASHYTDRVNRAEMAKWTPIAATGVAVALLLVVRRPTNALIAATSLACALAWTYGAMALLDVEVSFLTVFLAPVVIGVGVDYAIHLLHRYEAERDGGLGVRDAVARALRTTGGAVLVAALTTVSALATLLLVPAPLFAQIGGVGALGIALGFVAALTVVPALRAVIPERRRRRAPRDRLGEWVAGAVARAASRPGIALGLVAVVLAGAGYVAATRTTIESGSAENEFPQDDPVIVLQQRVEREYGAFQRAYLVVRGDLAQPHALEALLRASERASALPLHREASSVVDLLVADAKTDQGAADLALDGLLTPAGAAPSDAERLPATAAEARERLDRLFADPLWRSIAPFTISHDYRLAVVAVTIETWTSQQELLALRDALAAQATLLDDELGGGYDVAAAGAPVNRAAIIEQTPLDVGLATGGATIAVLVVLLVAWARRGLQGAKAAAAAAAVVAAASLLLVATVPLLDATYALLHRDHGFAANRATLNDMFLLAFAVTVAVGVDDLVLLAHRRWEALDAGATPDEAWRAALMGAGRSITGTTVTTFVGFASMSGIYFLQSKNLAILTALGVAYAYGLTLVLAPLALKVVAKKGETADAGAPAVDVSLTPR